MKIRFCISKNRWARWIGFSNDWCLYLSNAKMYQLNGYVLGYCNSIVVYGKNYKGIKDRDIPRALMKYHVSDKEKKQFGIG